jgi:hypothetical protein
VLKLSLVAFAALFAACHGTVGPSDVPLPLDSIEFSGVPSRGTVGDRFPLKVIATYVHGTTEEVTSRVTWTSSNAATAAVEGGELMLKGVGESEIRASLDAESASFSVSVEARPPGRFTLSGVVADSATKRGVPIATVEVVGGSEAGRSTLTDEGGFYSLAALLEGTFTLRVTRTGYETTESATTLAADTRVDLVIKPLPPPPFTGGSWDIRVVQGPTKCDIDLASSGRLVLSGTPRRLMIRITQPPFDVREYSGSLEDDGTFTGSTSLFASVDGPPDTQAHGVSTIKGLLLDSKVSGTEKIATHLCPGGLGIVNVGFQSR